MIPLLLPLLLAQSAHAEPGRVTAGATAGLALDLPGAESRPGRLCLRGSADLGLVRHLSLSAELGTAAPPTAAPSTHSDGLRPALAAGLGPRLDLVDGRWLRIGVVLLPELLVEVPALDPSAVRAGLAADGGLRASWLMLWGLSLTARLDGTLPLHGAPWVEAGAGLALRL